MQQQLTQAHTLRIAELAMLRLTPEETELFTMQLQDILDYASQLAASIDTIRTAQGTLPTMVNVFRPDEVSEGLTNAAALAGAPSVEAGKFRVPPILDVNR